MSASIKLFHSFSFLFAVILVRFVILAYNPCHSGTCVVISKCRNNLNGMHFPCGRTKYEIQICCDADSLILEKTKHEIIENSSKSEETEFGMRMINTKFCGKNVLNLIANGEDASISELPWMAFFVYQVDGTPMATMKCAGTLITSQYVLTAAHCILYSLFKVRLGEYDIREDPDCTGHGFRKKCAPPIQEIEVEEGIRHSRFDSHKFINDIGLVRLKRKAVFSETVQPICLPIVDQSAVLISADLIIAGWGRIDVSLDAVVLQRATVSIADTNYCQALFNSVKIDDKQICAESKNRSQVCRGDSGGPLLYYSNNLGDAKYVQYGITSFGASTCNSGHPEVFTNVVSFLHWIASNIRP